MCNGNSITSSNSNPTYNMKSGIHTNGTIGGSSYVVSPPTRILPGCFDYRNPFAVEEEDESSRIEADLQRLGGQMVGSILDF
eukprot:15332512-Ditylum_brightwellii.AAC.1